MNILHLTSIIPAPISTKSRENDILIRLAEEYEHKYPGSRHHFLFITPFSNWFFALLKKKWREYLDILRRGSFEFNGYHITVIGIPGFKNDILFRQMLAQLGYWLFRKRIQKALHLISPDFVHAHNMGNNLELAELLKRKYGLKYILTARSINSIALKRIRRHLLNPSSIVAHSKLSALRCSDSHVSVQIIPHPVESFFFVEDNCLARIDSGKLKLVSICNLIRLKNIDKVFTAIKDLDIDVIYNIYGDGPEKENLMALAKSYNLGGRVLFKGHTTHQMLSQELMLHDLFVMPSYPETLGRVYFEAMASGLPVIASKNTGIDGMIEHHVHGYLVDHTCLNEIKTAIMHFASLPPEERIVMKKNAIDFSRQFTWDSVLHKYHKLYSTILT